MLLKLGFDCARLEDKLGEKALIHETMVVTRLMVDEEFQVFYSLGDVKLRVFEETPSLITGSKVIVGHNIINPM